ncbi:hypothetical protein [Corynebacterium cystitidis]|uniref:Myb-like domain-containing protein n=1 Tax=Corynebacterium cystitidis DSM 20524 TaxID=1121357 RepID=A0A1H9RTP6_9CORY|nr:hypothetical protein [Corynebacterium cystitidis]WJY82065.1 hypothetical protein CCYS_05645 [Corynebacterium cystitidis DSM 20524]SER75795.1 hypothetical protein SAMN05661109_00903 [Corynebacterium cystitidis DSM 20524]SNV79931.1 Uncharacterised protein [Corynebacterium cystitidis]
MPRSIEDILAHADELARRFEEYTPSPEDELDSCAVEALREAVYDRSLAEKKILAAIQNARNSGFTWETIGTFVGTSGEAARQRYARHLAS